MQISHTKLKGFNNKQNYEIALGLQRGLTAEEVSFYARPTFDSDQMAQIRAGFEAGLPIGMIELYAKASMPWQDMKKMRLELTRAQRKRQQSSAADHAIQESPVGSSEQYASIVIANIKNQLDKVNPTAWEIWAERKQIFMYDKDLVAKILEDLGAVERLESNILSFSPYRAALLICPFSDNRDWKILFSLLPDNNLEFYIFREKGEVSQYKVSLHKEKKIGELIAEYPAAEKKEIITALQLYICLCSAQNKNMEATSKPILEDDLNDVYIVTFQELTSKYQSGIKDKGASSSKAAYMRKAHWHRYWVGPRNIKEKRRVVLRWIPETTVNAPAQLSIRISLVKHPAAYRGDSSIKNKRH